MSMRTPSIVQKVIFFAITALSLSSAALADVPSNQPRLNNNENVRTDESERGARGTARQHEELTQQALTAYKELLRGGEQQSVPRSVVQKARCVAIFPEVISAALVVGGTHGDGVAFCKENERWGNPLFLDMTGGSLGAQLGAKSTDLVLFIIGDKAKQQLKNGSFRIGGDISAVAGSFDGEFKVPSEGVVSYRAAEGVFAGAALTGTNISIDRDSMTAYYGGDYNINSIISGQGRVQMSQAANELKQMLPS